MIKSVSKLSSLLLMGGLLLASCQRSGDCGCDIVNPYDAQKGNLKVASNIIDPATRVAGNNWEVSDAIGIYAVKGGTALADANVITDGGNKKYTTAKAGATVNFTSTEGITIPADGNVDIISYYPYNATINGYKLAFNNSDQSNLSAIDLLYSNNQKGISNQNLQANLVFKHALTLVEFDITAESGLTIPAGATVEIKDVMVDGNLSLVDGVVATGTTKATPKATIKANGANFQAMMILPPQNLNGKEVVFTIDGKQQKATLNLTETKQGYKYIVNVNYGKKSGILIIAGATIEDWKNGDTDTIVIGGEDTPVPPTPPTPQPTTGTLLFPGSNFDDFAAFKGCLNNFGLKTYATQADGGKTGKALQIKGTPEKNDYVFTATTKTASPAGSKAITFYIKGKVAGRSMSFNVYTSDREYKVFNLGDVNGSGDIKLDTGENNQYAGSIDTKGEWAKVTLNISGLTLNASGNIFAVKVGKGVAWDLMIDDITIE